MKVIIFDKFPTVDFQDSIVFDFEKETEQQEIRDLINISLNNSKTVLLYNNEVNIDEEE
jgi:hypothetical protein